MSPENTRTETVRQDAEVASATFLKLPAHKQERVYAAALEEFAAHGFQAASSNRMAKALGIAKGSLFKYFGNKEGLFRYVFERAAHDFGQALRVAREDTRGRPLAERLEAALCAGLALVDAHPAVYRLYLRMLFQETFPLRATLLAQVRTLSTRYIRSLVEDAIDPGEAGAHEVETAVFLIDAALDRALQARRLPYMDTLGLHDASREQTHATARHVATLLAETVNHIGARRTPAQADHHDDSTTLCRPAS